MIPDTALDALYDAPPSRYVEVRKTLAQGLKKAGDKDAAAELLALGKPTPGAWAVNQIARKHPEAIARLGAVGERLRSAMRRGLAGDPAASKEVAAIEKEQRACIADLAKLAASLLEAAGASASATVIERVETTLKTIGTTGSWGDATPGRLARDLEPPSVADLAALLLDPSVPAPAPKRPAAPAASEQDAAREAAAEEAAAAAAQEAAEAAAQAAREAAIREADAALRAAAHAAKTATARVDSLRREADELRAEAERAAARVEKIALELEAARTAERRAREIASEAAARVASAAGEARALCDVASEAERARRALGD